MDEKQICQRESPGRFPDGTDIVIQRAPSLILIFCVDGDSKTTQEWIVDTLGYSLMAEGCPCFNKRSSNVNMVWMQILETYQDAVKNMHQTECDHETVLLLFWGSLF